MRRNKFSYAWREGGFLVPDRTIDKNMCKKNEDHEFRITDPSNRQLSAGIVDWVNSMTLSFDQRNAFTLALANQGVFYLNDVSLLDIEAVMHRISTVTSRFMAVWTPDEARHFSEKLSAQRFALIAQRTGGTDVVAKLANRGGALAQWRIPILPNCSRVASNTKHLVSLAMEVLETRGLAAPLEENETPEEALSKVNLQYTKDGSKLFVGTVAEMMCKGIGGFTMFVDSPEDKAFSSDIVGWMNVLKLTFDQRQGLREGLVDQKIVSLTQMAHADVAQLEAKVLSAWPSVEPAFKASLAHAILEVKSWVLKELKPASPPIYAGV